MTERPVTIYADLDIFTVADKFIHSTFRRLLVVDEDNRLIGQITRRDLLRAIQKMHEG